MDGREFMRRLERRQQQWEERFRRQLLEALETPEQRRQREAAEEQERLRRVWAKVGLSLEEAEERIQEFERKFGGGYR